eukprot:TRINITY_DN32468_c0_g1_i1.p1 TRINITY_DN32468_c0_g1~~TRINITY_DN32468_c0_g1_i1.p1  ORF type:complete len:382 (+),score=71.81 TRINITY_DN32468_c0_g1_i1:56-1201(+)
MARVLFKNSAVFVVIVLFLEFVASSSINCHDIGLEFNQKISSHYEIQKFLRNDNLPVFSFSLAVFARNPNQSTIRDVILRELRQHNTVKDIRNYSVVEDINSSDDFRRILFANATNPVIFVWGMEEVAKDALTQLNAFLDPLDDTMPPKQFEKSSFIFVFDIHDEEIDEDWDADAYMRSIWKTEDISFNADAIIRRIQNRIILQEDISECKEFQSHNEQSIGEQLQISLWLRPLLLLILGVAGVWGLFQSCFLKKSKPTKVERVPFKDQSFHHFKRTTTSIESLKRTTISTTKARRIEEPLDVDLHHLTAAELTASTSSSQNPSPRVYKDNITIGTKVTKTEEIIDDERNPSPLKPRDLRINNVPTQTKKRHNTRSRKSRL